MHERTESNVLPNFIYYKHINSMFPPRRVPVRPASRGSATLKLSNLWEGLSHAYKTCGPVDFFLGVIIIIIIMRLIKNIFNFDRGCRGILSRSQGSHFDLTCLES